MVVPELTVELSTKHAPEILHNRAVILTAVGACIFAYVAIFCKYVLIIARAHPLHNDEDYGKTSSNILRRLCMLSTAFSKLWMGYFILSRWDVPYVLPGIQYALKVAFAIGAVAWAHLAYCDFRAAYLLRTPTSCLCSRQATLLPTVNPTEVDREKLMAPPSEKALALTMTPDQGLVGH